MLLDNVILPVKIPADVFDFQARRFKAMLTNYLFKICLRPAGILPVASCIKLKRTQKIDGIGITKQKVKTQSIQMTIIKPIISI